jgi:hypothetical protein
VTRAAEQDRPDVAAKRAGWRAAQPSLNPERLVFLDETWAATNLARRYGRAPVGERLVWAVADVLRQAGLAQHIRNAVNSLP